jgi:hypothetical protein
MAQSARDLTFTQVLKRLDCGRKCKRPHWRDLTYIVRDDNRKDHARYVWKQEIPKLGNRVDTREWVPSQDDMMATDWICIDGD